MFIADQCPEGWEKLPTQEPHAYNRFIEGSNPEEENESGIGQRTVDIQETKPGSQGICFALLDMGLSQLMLNTRQLVRFLPCGTNKPDLLTKGHIQQSCGRD